MKIVLFWQKNRQTGETSRNRLTSMCIFYTWQRLYCIGVWEIWNFHTQKVGMGKLYCSSTSCNTQNQFQVIE